MFLSVIIPVYNAEKYLAECIESCLRQDISCDDYEIICVNDGSTDKSAEILSLYEKQYKTVKVIEQPNGGVSRARNTGFDAAKGDNIWFVDADDILSENVIGKIKIKMTSSGCDYLRIGMYRFGEKLTPEIREKAALHTLEANCRIENIFAVSRVYRKAFLTENGIRYDEGITNGEDSLFSFRVDRAGGKSAVLNITAYLYRIHPSSASHSGGNAIKIKYIKSHFMIMRKIRDCFDDDEPKKLKTVRALYSAADGILITLAQLPFSEARPLIKAFAEEKSMPFFIPHSFSPSEAAASLYSDIMFCADKILIHIAKNRPGFRILYLRYRIHSTERYKKLNGKLNDLAKKVVR